MIPIWKDYYFDLGTASVVPFSVSVNGTEVYNGTSHKRPEEERNRIKVNDIVADYFSQFFPSAGGATKQSGLTAVVKVSPQGGTAKTQTFAYDWSFETEEVNPGIVSAPITGEVTPWMPIPVTAIQVLEVRADVGNLSFWANFTGAGDFLAADFNNDFFTEQQTGALVADGVARFTIPSGAEGAIKLQGYTAGNVKKGKAVTLRIVDGCHNKALYYVNPFGGWDALLIKGSVRQYDNYDRKTLNHEYDNSDQYGKGSENYLNGWSRRYELVTGWMTDSAAKRMHYLFGSTNVYIYDADTQRFTPVRLTGNECEAKTFRSEGRMVSYTIQAVESNERMRR